MFKFISNMFPQSNLCNEEGIKTICYRFSPKILEQSIDSAHAINLCLHLVQDWYETCPYKELFDYIYNRLINGHIVDYDKYTCKIYIGHEYYENLPLDTGNIKCFEYNQPIGTLARNNFDLMVARWICYYMQRMPMMLHVTTYQKKHLSNNEIYKIIESCLLEIYKTKYADSTCIKLLKVYIDDVGGNEKERTKFIEDYNWLFYEQNGRDELIPKIKSLSMNQRFLLFTLLNKYFHIFYHSLQEFFSIYCLQLAYLTGGFIKD